MVVDGRVTSGAGVGERVWELGCNPGLVGGQCQRQSQCRHIMQRRVTHGPPYNIAQRQAHLCHIYIYVWKTSGIQWAVPEPLAFPNRMHVAKRPTASDKFAHCYARPNCVLKRKVAAVL